MHVSIPFEILQFVSSCVAECPPLGMESHKIESDQLSASSVSQYKYSPQRARLNMQVRSNYSVLSCTFKQESCFTALYPAFQNGNQWQSVFTELYANVKIFIQNKILNVSHHIDFLHQKGRLNPAQFVFVILGKTLKLYSGKTLKNHFGK